MTILDVKEGGEHLGATLLPLRGGCDRGAVVQDQGVGHRVIGGALEYLGCSEGGEAEEERNEDSDVFHSWSSMGFWCRVFQVVFYQGKGGLHQVFSGSCTKKGGLCVVCSRECSTARMGVLCGRKK